MTHRSLPAPEVMTLLSECAPALAAAFDLNSEPWAGAGDVRVFEGPTRIEGDFAVGPEIVVVLGDLDVSGWLSDTCDADVTLLLVTGNVRADRALFLSQVAIGGNLDVRTLVYANALNDWSLEVAGDLSAGALVEGGTFCKIGGAVTCPYVWSTQNAIVAGQNQTPVVKRRERPKTELLRPELIEDGCPNQDAILEAMSSGAPTLQDG